MKALLQRRGKLTFVPISQELTVELDLFNHLRGTSFSPDRIVLSRDTPEQKSDLHWRLSGIGVIAAS